MSLKPLDKLAAARLKMNIHHPFYASLMYKQRLVIDDPCTTTMAVDGKCLFISTSYLARFEPTPLMGVLIHEMEHLVRKHHLRRGERHPIVWNIACDAVINIELDDAGIVMPDEGGVDLPWARGMTAEAVYERLLKECGGDSGAGSLPGGDAPGQVLDFPAQTKDQQDQGHADIELAVHEALMTAKLKGKLPLGEERIVDGLQRPSVPWQDLLRELIRGATQGAATWSRPHRRLPGKSPGYFRQGLGNIIIYQDTSGSMSAKELGYSRAEVMAVLDEFRPDLTHFLACDSEIHNHVELGPDDSLDAKMFKGGGGSDFHPAFEYVAKNISDATLAIVLSDMIIDFPITPPPYPVIGVTTTKHKGPSWMQTISREKQFHEA